MEGNLPVIVVGREYLARFGIGYGPVDVVGSNLLSESINRCLNLYQ